MRGFSDKVVWAVAEENCINYGPSVSSHLVSIHNMQENTEVMHQMAKCKLKQPIVCNILYVHHDDTHV